MKQHTENGEATVDNVLSSRIRFDQKEHIPVMNKETDNKFMGTMKLLAVCFNKHADANVLFDKNTQVYNDRMNAFISIHIIETINGYSPRCKDLEITVFDSINHRRLEYAKIIVVPSVVERVILLEEVQVYKKYRNKYIGGSIMDAIVNIANANNIQKLIVNEVVSFGSDLVPTSYLHRFYEKHGFVVKRGGYGAPDSGVLLLAKGVR